VPYLRHQEIPFFFKALPTRGFRIDPSTFHRVTVSVYMRASLAERYSGHSGRVGFVVAAKEAGAADSDIASTTRHRSLQMIKRYGEAAE
jgi:hypothetical protein